MGSNSFRLEIGQVQDGRYRRHLYLKETVRLGAGLDIDGMLTEEATERGLRCLSSFAQTLKSSAPMQVRAVATQTLREARNRDQFLLRAEAALGHPIEVISGREEARLIYTGVAFLQPSTKPRLVIDIGGRSTEMILGDGRAPRVAALSTEQQAALQEIAITGLKAQKERLAAYTAQARFAVAQLYDRATEPKEGDHADKP